MFRKMRRFKQQMTEEECRAILKEQPRGILSVIGDDGYPYGIPLSHYYDEETGKIYFHGAGEGHKIDSIRRCDKVSFCVCDEGYRNEGDWALNIRSVIVFGRIREITDIEEKIAICRNLGHKFTDDEEYIEDDIRRNKARVLCLEITIEHMTGKRVKEA